MDIVFVDYLQLMTSGSRIENRVQEVSYLSRSLKALAREMDVPVMTASQLSRAVEKRQDKHPVLSDLRESGSIEQDADVVMFIYRDELYHEDTELKNIAEVMVAKHRSGPTGSIQLFFNKRLTQFLDATTSHTPPPGYQEKVEAYG
jgi:replicative DNA helicase